MKTTLQSREVETFGLEESTSFGIRATAKAFEILSSSLYRNKIRAVLREISANARDAHIDNGCIERPFDVHLPTTLSPHLSIRDYGKGMSHAHMSKVYQTYFASLKEDSDDFIGGLGLGSKSPFAYTDAYTAISRHQGERRTYDLYKDDVGEPKIAVRSVEPMLPDEETGLEVIVPLGSANDQYEFAKEAGHVYELYPVQPNLTGRRFESVQNRGKVIFSGDGWTIRDGRGYHQTRAVMDVIAYMIDAESVITGKDALMDRSLATARALLTANIDVEFKIGELDITAGREDISYVKLTKQRLRDRFIAIGKEMDAKVKAEFASCKTLLAAKKRYAELFDYHSPMRSILGEKYSVEFRGQKINDSILSVDLDQLPKSRMIHYTTSRRGNRRVTSEIVPTSHSAYSRGDTPHKLAIDAKKSELLFFYDDMEGKGHHNSRVFHLRETNSAEVVVIQTSSKTELKAIRRAFDGIEIKNVSELPKPTYERSAVRAKHKALTPYARAGNSRISAPRDDDRSWMTIDIDPNEGGIYVVTSRGQITDEDGNTRDHEFSQMYQISRALGMVDVDENIIAVPLSMIKQLTETKKYSGKWVNFFDVIRERAPSVMTPDVLASVALRGAVGRFSPPTNRFDVLRQAIIQRLPTTHSLRGFIDTFDAASTDACNPVKASQISDLAAFLKLPLQKNNVDYDKLWAKAVAPYVLLEYVMTNDTMYRTPEKIVKLVLDYIELVDHNTTNQQEA